MIQIKKTDFQVVVTEIQYLPCLEFWACCDGMEELRLETKEHFQKQTFRNRCQILTAQGIDTLIVPVLDGRSQTKTFIQDIRIDYQQPWVKRHWGAIESAYRKAPYFEYFADTFRKVYEQKPAFLYDLNISLLTICRELLRIQQKVSETHEYLKQYEYPILDIRGHIVPKNSFIERSCYRPVLYRQNFGEQFFPNLSILDVLFCQGNEAQRIIKASSKLAENDALLQELK
ncbi:MAG: WbqC family protein [Siphonobacter sp.]